MAKQPAMVNLADVHQAVRELEAAAATGDISPTEASSRINAAKRAVTPRELWKASGGRAGANKRSDWPDIRKTVLAIILLLILVAVGVWIATYFAGVAVDTGIVPEPPPSVPDPTQ